MKSPTQAQVHQWLVAPLDPEVRHAIERLQRAGDIQQLAIMPDVHLAQEVCVGVALATTHRLYPAAVGGDIGCGMAAIGFDQDASWLADEHTAAALLAALYEIVPTHRHPKASMPTLPRALQNQTLSHPGLEKHKARDGTVQFATLGRGNHFLEFQADQDGQLWLMLHSGSRAMGQNIRAHHTRDAQHDETTGLAYLDARTPQGQAYLQDVQWALTYAHESRNTMLHNVCNMLAQRFEIHAIPETRINCHHNEVRQETIQTQTLWVHRKGAMRAQDGQPGIIPGSMGATSFHVLGRGNPKALLSSSHGAGRCMSRTQARKTFSTKQLTQQMKGIWFNHRIAHKLRDEAPNAYKNIHAVMRAQQQLTKITRSLNPILSYKGT